MQQVADWLERLGLGQYAQRFAENDISFSVLPDLTDQDLKEIGVLARSSAPTAASDSRTHQPRERGSESPAAPAAASAAPQDTAERRQVTVMFSDLVGSTALSARMDPEDLREVISAYQKCVAETVQRFGGFVAKYMGDGVLVYFGYPQAHEDDAERAVRAGLELIAGGGRVEVQLLHFKPALASRPGLVVVGDLIGSGAAQEQRSSARRRTSRHDCRASPSRTRSSSPRARESCSAICSSCRTSEPRTSRASLSRCELGRRCGPARLRAASRRCTRAA